ncbi:DUF3828 domain-containing protein [Rhizobium sp. FKL33]|uniref:DUF3828 domain-containing protein n=1 Tax=Rhizobium sp. FKL33 TaxID=2562307 RepID=UPI0010C083ED|nr:DUF3828 domain-containing protein [Rhizobium sp. FKL33]
MRLPALLVTVFAVMSLAFTVHAETYKSPQALIKALYAYDVEKADFSLPSVYSPFLSKGLNVMFKKEREFLGDDQVGALDFDPVINGQDGAATNLKIGKPVILKDKAELEVTFTNGEPVRLHYKLVRENGGWKVDDIAKLQGEYPWSVRKLLTYE